MIPHSNPTPDATFVGRVWQPNIGPCVVVLRGDAVIDITSKDAPTMRDLLERDDLLDFVSAATGDVIGTLSDVTKGSVEAAGEDALHFLAPSDLQAVKASGVTFAESMVERVIEEQAAGNADRAEEIRLKVKASIGDSLSGIVPGSEKAMEVKAILQSEGLWSQYLEVGIGPDAEVFTKSQPMGAVGWGASVGLHPMSSWNNPEPEVVLAVTSTGMSKGALHCCWARPKTTTRRVQSGRLCGCLTAVFLWRMCTVPSLISKSRAMMDFCLMGIPS
jgi:fumarylacetoacetate (FAA) hydrolase family protein